LILILSEETFIFTPWTTSGDSWDWDWTWFGYTDSDGGYVVYEIDY